MVSLNVLNKNKIIPVVVLEDAEKALPLAEALKAGGIDVIEITFRTAAAPEAIKKIAEAYPEFVLGAGTVTTLDEVEQAKSCGAQFAVAPGLNPNVVLHAQQHQLPFYPGVCAPSDVERAMDLGCTILKFFPAEAVGGTTMLKALYGPYKHRGIGFVPTGGIKESTFMDYLNTPGVLAIGGSWLVDKKLIDAGDWDAITKLSKQAVEKAQSV